MVPSSAQIYAAQQQQQHHSNPNSPNANASTTSRRSPPPHVAGQQVQRALPTPPLPNPPPFRDDHSPEHHSSMSPSPGLVANANPAALSPIHPRPIPRVSPPQFLTKFGLQDVDTEDKWKLNELMAEIEQADLEAQTQQQQQAQENQSLQQLPQLPQSPQTQAHQVQSLSYPRDRDGQSPARDAAVERVKTMGRGDSTKESSVATGGADPVPPSQPPRRQTSIRDRDRGDNRDGAPAARSSPKSMVRHSSSSATTGSFSPPQSHHPRTQTPESYQPYRPHLSLASQAQTHTPPLQTIGMNAVRTDRTPEVVSSVRTPDKSLPVQELDDDQGDVHFGGSPMPSSDLNPDGHSNYGHGGPGGRNNHRRSLDNHPRALSKPRRAEDDDEDATLFEKSDMDRQEEDQDGAEEDIYSFTPRSSQVGLPDTGPTHRPQAHNTHSQSNSPVANATTSRDRERERPRSSDQLPSKYDHHQKPMSPSLLPRSSQGQTQAPFHLHPTFNPGTPDNQSLYSGNGSFHSADMMDHPTHAYIAYLRSVYPAYEQFRSGSNYSRGSSLRPRDDRPDAPIPPTPHSQTNPPSPSPLLSTRYALDDMSMSNASQVLDGIYLRGELEGFDGMGVESGREYLPPFSPIIPAGSPYPYPFSHVRRAKSYAHHPNPLENSRTQSSSHNGGDVNKDVPAGNAKENNNKTNGNGNTNHHSSQSHAQTTSNSNSSAAAAAAANLTNMDIIQEQFARQWQIYAQNLQAQIDQENGYGDITDSTFSPPSATPSLLPPINRTGTGMGINGHIPFNPWAYWHTQRLLGRTSGNGSITARSSPSHEPVPLPTPPPTLGARRKGRSMDLRTTNRGGGGGVMPGQPEYGNMYNTGGTSGRDSVQGLGLSGLSSLASLRSVSPIGGPLRGRGVKPAQPHPLRQGRKPPPRVESTQPRDTSPEPLGSSSDSGEETAGEGQFAIMDEGNWVNGGPSVPGVSNGKVVSLSAPTTPMNIVVPQPLPTTVPIPIVDESTIATLGEVEAGGGGHSNDWVDEDEYDDEDDLLELEYHPSFVSNVDKRRRRWENKWEALNQAFQTLDRQTDATMVLLAAPSHSTKLHMITSRSIRRRSDVPHSSSLNTIRAGFKQIAVQRRRARTVRTSLADRFLSVSGHGSSGGSGDGSDGSSDLSSTRREEDLKRALDAALGSLGFLGNLYEEREARWVDEMRKVREERERVAFLLTQVLGDKKDNSPGVESVTGQSISSSDGTARAGSSDTN
ncbi:hypothetical protein K435DRAFT_780633 [Dendrothele bispora CBS 962.96]|uniref:Uncharacterized protein n=1 Tax=Dendrothele bispora (strain CBS 962.96) TaxID=1314807 RepID=A0A4S8LRR4_DENBC|nr:hypothetical protein K435DRAFT_780633 [Dendrothele bispora CBS 962.96]